MFPQILQTIQSCQSIIIHENRLNLLQQLIDYINIKIVEGKKVNLNFICTHNSRRSQFAQIWAQTAADYYKVEVSCFSGGVEVTSFNQNAVETIIKAGFLVTKNGSPNPVYSLKYSESGEVITAFSKLFDDEVNPISNFTAVMTCSDADENCPFIPGAENRIPLLYDDPKLYDNTPEEAAKYDERSNQIAREMFYVFSMVQRN